MTLHEMANLHFLGADFAAARVYLEASRDTIGGLADTWDEDARGFVGGQIALHEGRYDEAHRLLTSVLGAARCQNGSLLSGYCLMILGIVAREQGQHDEARALLDRARQIALHYRDNALLAHSFEVLSAVASACERHDRALQLGGAAAALREAAGVALNPAWRLMVERWLAPSRMALPGPVGGAAWNTGQAMSTTAVIAYAKFETAPSASGSDAAAPCRSPRSHLG
jgi:hypothetical protein